MLRLILVATTLTLTINLANATTVHNLRTPPQDDATKPPQPPPTTPPCMAQPRTNFLKECPDVSQALCPNAHTDAALVRCLLLNEELLSQGCLVRSYRPRPAAARAEAAVRAVATRRPKPFIQPLTIPRPPPHPTDCHA